MRSFSLSWTHFALCSDFRISELPLPLDRTLIFALLSSFYLMTTYWFSYCLVTFASWPYTDFLPVEFILPYDHVLIFILLSYFCLLTLHWFSPCLVYFALWLHTDFHIVEFMFCLSRALIFAALFAERCNKDERGLRSGRPGWVKRRGRRRQWRRRRERTSRS